MDAVETARIISEYVPPVVQAATRVTVVGETEEEKQARQEAKKARQELKNLFKKGEVDLAQVWGNVVY